MTDISVHLPTQSKTVAAIFAHYKKVGDSEPVRGYLGASIIGHPCERYLWYCFRQCCTPDISGRIYRLFETGNLEENRFNKNLRAIGCEVHDKREDDQQFEVSTIGGHFSGHMDGCALGIPEAPKTWHVLEFKTHNAKSFRELVKKGVQIAKLQHYDQMQVYMHLTGMKRALYLARNKDDDDLYSERISYDKIAAEFLTEKAERIITSTTPPERISGRRDYYLCGWCDAKGICRGTELPEPALPLVSLSCRQCCHATPVIDGKNARWQCKKRNKIWCSGDEILCEHHLVLPGLLAFAEPTDYGVNEEGNDFIEFTNEDDTKWGHGDAAGCYSSVELMKLPASTLTNEFLHGATELFGATVTDYQVDILDRYPEGDSRIVWKGHVDNLLAVWQVEYNEDLLKLIPISRSSLLERNVVELEGGRIAIVWPDGAAEIRKGVE